MRPRGPAQHRYSAETRGVRGGSNLRWGLHVFRLYSFRARYGTAVLATALACTVYLITGPPDIDGDLRYFGFALTVLITAILGDFGPGLVATVLSALLSAFLLIPPIFSFQIASPDSAGRLLLFTAEGTLLSFMGHLIHKTELSEKKTSGVMPYALAVVFVGGAAALKLTISPQLEQQYPFSFFYAAVALSAWAGGIGPGAAATVLSAFGARLLFMAPRYSLAALPAESIVRLLLFALEGLAVAWLTAYHFKAQALLEIVTQQLATYAQRLWKNMESATALRAISRDVLWEWDLSSAPVEPRTMGAKPEQKAVMPMQFLLWLEQVHPEDQLEVVASLKLAIDEGQREWLCEYRRQGPGGAYIYASDHAYIIRDAAWNAVRVIGRSADVLEESLSKFTGQDTGVYRAAFENNPLAMLLVNSALHVMQANEAACEVFRNSSAGISKLHVEKLFEEASRGSVLETFLELESEGAPSITFEADCVRVGGEIFHARVFAGMIGERDRGSADRIITLEEID